MVKIALKLQVVLQSVSQVRCYARILDLMKVDVQNLESVSHKKESLTVRNARFTVQEHVQKLKYDAKE